MPAHDVIASADALRFYSGDSYCLCGADRRISSSDDARILQEIRDALYSAFYCRLGTGPRAYADTGLGRRALLTALSAANTGCSALDPEWIVTAVDPVHQFEVTKNSISVWADLSQLDQTNPPSVGDVVVVKVPSELRALLSGFYTALGDARMPVSDRPLVTRLYWNVTSIGAPFAVKQLSSLLNGLGIPFRLKVLSDPNAYGRADAGILYIERAAYLELREALPRVHHELRPYLSSDVPRFVKRLAHGLGAAETPKGGDSFGMHRCELIVSALWRSASAGAPLGREDAYAAIRSAFFSHELDPDLPYLEPSAEDIYVAFERQPRPTTEL